MKSKTKLFQFVVVLALIFGTVYMPALAAPTVTTPTVAHDDDNRESEAEY